MNILMISDVYFPRVNGVSTSIMTFRGEMERTGHRVTLVAPDYGRGNGEEPGIVRIPSRRVPRDPEDRVMGPMGILARKEALREEAFDIVHIHTPFVAHYVGVRLARQLGLPCVETYHTFFEEYLYHYVPLVPRPLMRALARGFSRSQCNGVDALVVPSRAMRDALRGYGVTAPAEIIPTGIDLEQLGGGDGPAFRARHGIAPERPLMVYVGRVAFEKNIDFLLRMLVRVKGELPDALLVVAGEGPALGRLRKMAEALGLGENVLFVGYLSRSGELLDCYRAGNAFVFASRTETQGLVLLEAMALGVPVVSTAVMGTKDVLGTGKGALIAEENEEDFARKTVRLLRDRELQAELSAAGREWALQWGAGQMASRLLDFYRAVGSRALARPVPRAAR